MHHRSPDTAWNPSDRPAEPLRSLAQVQAVKALLADSPRDLLLFCLGVNNALRAGDLLRVTVNDVRGVAPGAEVMVREKHTGREGMLWVPRSAWEALGRHLELLAPPAPPGNMYLFASRPGWTPLTTARLDELVREWARRAGLHGEFGAHTLRRTFGYLQRTCHGVDLEVLSRRYGHPSTQVTLRYLGLAGDDVGPVRLTEL